MSKRTKVVRVPIRTLEKLREILGAADYGITELFGTVDQLQAAIERGIKARKVDEMTDAEVVAVFLQDSVDRGKAPKGGLMPWEAFPLEIREREE